MKLGKVFWKRTIDLFHQNSLKRSGQCCLLHAMILFCYQAVTFPEVLSTEPLINQVRFKVLATVTSKIVIFLKVMSCILTEVYRNSPTLTFVLITTSITTNPIYEQRVISELVYRGHVLWNRSSLHDELQLTGILSNRKGAAIGRSDRFSIHIRGPLVSRRILPV